MALNFDLIRQKFRQGEDLTSVEADQLKRLIIDSEDIWLLSEAIYFYCYLFPFEDGVHKKCISCLERGESDELSAICVKGVFTFWGAGTNELALQIFDRISVSSFDERFEENQAVLKAYKDGDFLKGNLQVQNHLAEFVKWGQANGYDLSFLPN